jgi:hypothetical protein
MQPQKSDESFYSAYNAFQSKFAKGIQARVLQIPSSGICDELPESFEKDIMI